MSDNQPPSSPFDWLRAQALVFTELRRLQQGLIEKLLLPAAQGQPGAAMAPTQGEVEALLRRLQVLVLEYPLAAQAAFSALVAEGRRFASTPEGAAWKEALAGSELVRNGRPLWDALSLNLLEEDPATVVPSAYLEALFQAVRSPELEALARRLRGAAAGGPHGTP